MPVKMFTLMSLPMLMKIQYLTKELDIAWNFTIRWYPFPYLKVSFVYAAPCFVMFKNKYKIFVPFY